MKHLKSVIVILFFVLYTYKASTQDVPISLKSLQGIWSQLPTPKDSSLYITINKGFKSIGIGYETSFYFAECHIGFQDSSSYDIENFDIKQLKECGRYYTEIPVSGVNHSGQASFPDIQTPEILELSEYTMWIAYKDISIFSRIDKVPNIVLKFLYQRGYQDHRNYIKEYLDLRVALITSNTCIVYSTPNKSTQQQLGEGDIVTVLEEEKDWLRIEYGDDKKRNEGWIKKEDTE
jgi:hypothetical protein